MHSSEKHNIDIDIKIEKKTFQNKGEIFFVTLVICLYGLAIMTIIFTHGNALQFLIWNGETVGIFPDLYESIGAALNEDPYSLGSIYPAFTYMFCRFLGNLIIDSSVLAWPDLSLTRYAIVVSFFFWLFFCVFINYMQQKMYKSSKFVHLMIGVFFFLSSPFIYMMERGNLVIVSMSLIMVYLYGYDSSNKKVRLIAFFCLAIATAMKLYPVVLGLLLIKRNNLKSIVTAIGLGLMILIIPFFKFGGIQSIHKMIANILYLSNETLIDTRNFGFGYKIDTANLIRAVGEFFGLDFNSFSKIMTICILFMLILSSFLLKEKWKKITALLLILVVIPSFSWIYNVIYMFPAILIFLEETRQNNVNVKHYMCLFCLFFIFVPLPYGFIMNSLCGVNKMSISTCVCGLMLHLLIFLLILDLIFQIYKNVKQVLIRT